ncbi:Gfo/Idh/MocA family oxidoreductase [Rhizobium sp. P32RR-XVIII]|uniref:Gfo/Idh/MocA family oxidoreductase n=1 Tax=Rhizobium sp. P32RR-XVIII TaxID=2726738 RepID=UPI001FEDF759|nr:Gfo/Idh/MocA family oxidoreductase [Rhizobium sp. P32RR-XVIII]
MTSEAGTGAPVRIGVVGLGRAFMLTLPAFRSDNRVRLVAASEPREQSRLAFEREFGGRAYDNVADLCRDRDVELLYIASPHELHVEHVLAAAAAGKHVLVEKPLAISMDDARVMVEACASAGVMLLVGPSHSYDQQIQLARSIIDSGEVGEVRLIHGFNYTDFLYRPRRPEELQTERGGGVVFSQGIHQIDIVRLLAGGLTRDVVALTGSWDPRRSTEGAYSALLSFPESMACITYSGYAHFDSDEWMDNIGELGTRKDPTNYGNARRALEKIADADEEVRLKTARTYGVSDHKNAEPETYEHFGPLIVSCDRADMRITPYGIHLYNDAARVFRPTPRFRYPRSEIIEAIVTALRKNIQPAQTGAWGLASLEVCHAILQAAATRAPVHLKHQIGLRETP